MTTYNGEKFVSEQIDSILKQTISPCELIIVDDCSKDATYSILKEYEAKYPSLVKVYQNDTNQGPLYSFRRAFSLCSGDYIAPSDQDDIWFEDKLEKCYEACSDTVKVVFHQDRIWFADDSKVDSHYPNYTLDDIIYSPRCTGHTCFFHRSVLEVYEWVDFICYDWALVLYGLGDKSYRQIDYVGCLWRRHAQALTDTVGGGSFVKHPRGKWKAVFTANKYLLSGVHNTVIERDAHDQEIILSHFADTNPSVIPYIRLTQCFQKQTFCSFVKAGWTSVKIALQKKRDMSFVEKCKTISFAFRYPYTWWLNLHEYLLTIGCK